MFIWILFLHPSQRIAVLTYYKYVRMQKKKKILTSTALSLQTHSSFLYIFHISSFTSMVPTFLTFQRWTSVLNLPGRFRPSPLPSRPNQLWVALLRLIPHLCFWKHLLLPPLEPMFKEFIHYNQFLLSRTQLGMTWQAAARWHIHGFDHCWAPTVCQVLCWMWGFRDR